MIVALLVIALAAPAAARPGFGDYVKAVRALEEQRIEDAAALVEELAGVAPDDAEVQFLVAQVAFLTGEYDRALDVLGKLRDPRVRAEVAELEPLVKNTRAAVAGFARKETEHFVILYPPGRDEVLVDLAAEALEASWARIGEDLGYFPPGKTRVEILPRTSDLARVSTLTEKDIETSGTIALCKYNKLMIVSPRATLFGYPWLDTLGHEYTHFVVSRASLDRVPIWLHEGIAKFQESRWRAEPGEEGLSRSYQHLLATALKRGRLITFEQMHPSMALLPSQEAAGTAFAEVYTIVAWLQQKIGYAGLRQVLAKIREGRSERRAIAEVVGGTWDGVETAWKRHLRTLNLRTDPVQHGTGGRIRFDKTSGDDENVGVEQVPEEKARRLARLGGLLRARGHLAPAAIEYEKARAAAPEDRFIGHKLARTYLELDKPEKAIEVAAPIAVDDEEDAGPQATLGAAFLKLGDAVSAVAHLGAAVRVSPFDPAVRCGLAEAYVVLGEGGKAAREDKACALLRRGP
jgi:tetratricopeptide (TPR) repeat protein